MNDFLCNLDAPIVQTPKGKLRGFYQDGVYHFRGIRYGTAERFMAPRPVEPWEGVKDALVWGYTAPAFCDAVLVGKITAAAFSMAPPWR